MADIKVVNGKCIKTGYAGSLNAVFIGEQWMPSL